MCLQNRELIQASEGHLYATTRSGGPNGAGVLFRRNNNAERILRARVRNSGQALDVYGALLDDLELASIDDGARVIQYTPHGGANQQWLLRPVDSTAAPVTTASER